MHSVTSVILDNPLIKNAPALELVPEIDYLKVEINVLPHQIDELSQYSRKNSVLYFLALQKSPMVILLMETEKTRIS